MVRNFFKKWIGNEDLIIVISNSWSIGISNLSADLNLENKIKQLRLNIKQWALIHCSAHKHLKHDLIRSLGDWDIKAEAGNLTADDFTKRDEWLFDLD